MNTITNSQDLAKKAPAIAASETPVDHVAREQNRKRRSRFAIIVAITVLAGSIAAATLPVKMALALALLIFCIGMWATAIVPEYWPAMMFFLIAMLVNIAPSQIVFSGFHSSTFWLLFSGAIMGASISYTGLGKRAAALLSGMLGARYWQVISGIVFFSVALSFAMPSGMARAVLLIPITTAVAEQMGYLPGENGRLGMLMAAAFSSFLPSFAVLPSNAPNMVLSGMAENLYGIHISYGSYLLLHFPVLGALKSALLVILILWIYPDRDPARKVVQDSFSLPATPAEKRLSLVLVACLGFWMTDSFHHVSPAWVGLAAALYCLWPNSGLTSKKCLNEEINYGPLFFVAGVMGLGSVISSTGLGDAMVRAMSQYAGFSPSQPLWDISVLTVISTLTSVVTNLVGVPATMTPLARDMSTITGLPLTTVLMTQVLAFSNVFLPYQAPPLIFAMQTANLPVKAVTRLCLMLFGLSLILLTPLDLLWWHLLGLL